MHPPHHFLLLVSVVAAAFVLLVGQSHSFSIPRVSKLNIAGDGKTRSSNWSYRRVDGWGGSASSTTAARHLAVSDVLEGSHRGLDEKQLDFAMGYLNKHHSDTLTRFALAFTELGRIQAKRNAFSGGAYRVVDAKVVDIDSDGITLDATVNMRDRPEGSVVERVTFSLDADPIQAMAREYDASSHPSLPPPRPNATPIDDFVRRMNRLCNIVKHPSVTGKLIQLGIQLGGSGVGELKEDMYLNQVPHNSYVRRYFYNMAADATLDAVKLCSDGKIGNRMKMVCMFPEMNPSMDAYRIGTLLELARTIAIKLAEQNLRVRVCVQGSMGVGIFTGVPKPLTGVQTLLQRMDWQSNEGEENEGMVGEYVRFGGIGAEFVENGGKVDRKGNKIGQDDIFLLLCPQSMVGLECSIHKPLSEMVNAAGDRPVILINPDLSDKVSSQGQQSVRGRQGRIDFANSFETIYHFQNIYVSGTSYFPILGSMCKLGPEEPWVAHQRRDRVDGGGEVYVPVLSGEIRPEGETIMSTFES